MTIYLMEIVVILVLGVITSASRGDAERRCFIILACLVLFAFSGLRSYAVGVDTLQYWNAYLTAWMAHSWYETGFLYLLRALNVVSPNPQLLLLFTSAVMTACVGYVVYKSDCNPVLALFLYVTLLTYASFMNLMRQGIAAAIIIAAIPWLESGKRIRFAAAVIFGSLFHSTAIVMLALIPLSALAPTKKVMLGYGVVTLTLALSPDVVWSFVEKNFDKYSTYSMSSWSGGNALAAPIMTAMDALLIVVSHLFGVGASDDDREERVLFHGSMLQVIFQFLACFVNIFQRLTTFTSFFLALYVALRFRKIDTKLKFLLVYGICAVTVVFFVVIMVYRPQWHGVVPFSFFWQLV